jgi:hypothetical protein
LTALVWTVPRAVPLVRGRAVPVEALKPGVMVTFWAAAQDFGSWPWMCGLASGAWKAGCDTYVGAAGAFDEAEGACGAGPRGSAACLAQTGVVAETVDDVGSVAAWMAISRVLLNALARNGSSRQQARLTGYVASAKGISAGGTLGSSGGWSELLSLDKDFVDEAFVEHGSEAGRAKEEQGEGGREAHFDGWQNWIEREHF